MRGKEKEEPRNESKTWNHRKRGYREEGGKKVAGEDGLQLLVERIYRKSLSLLNLGARSLQ